MTFLCIAWNFFRSDKFVKNNKFFGDDDFKNIFFK